MNNYCVKGDRYGGYSHVAMDYNLVTILCILLLPVHNCVHSCVLVTEQISIALYNNLHRKIKETS